MKTSDVLNRYAILLIFVAAFVFYGISAGVKITKQTKTPHYIYLAYSFLHGKTNLIATPDGKFDLISFEGKSYVIGGVAPALLALPFVAVFGITFSDVLFGVFIGALNVAMMYSLLTRLVEKTSTRIWLTVFFASGTSHWALASVGSVWLNAQLTALLFMILFAWATIRDETWQAGLWLGLASLARPPIVVAALFYLTYVFIRESNIGREQTRIDAEKKIRALRVFSCLILKKLIPFGLALCGCWIFTLGYNYLRFGAPLDFGYEYLVGTKTLTDAYAASGGFNVQYMPCNIYVSLLGAPNIDLPLLPRVNAMCAHLDPITRDFGKASKFFNPLGMSMFLAAPALLLIFRAKLRDDLVVPAWVGAISVLIPLWMYHATGWVQFGYRFTTDFMVFILILLARAVKQVGYLEKTLIGLSVIMGAIGMYLTYYSVFGLFWHEMFYKLLYELTRKIYRIAF